MKTWKLVSGIISIVLSVFVVFQSMIAGLANALEESGQVSGSAGLVVGARNGNRERLIQSCYGDKKELESKTDGLAARDA